MVMFGPPQYNDDICSGGNTNLVSELDHNTITALMRITSNFATDITTRDA
jgi:hypothetical protein